MQMMTKSDAQDIFFECNFLDIPNEYIESVRIDWYNGDHEYFSGEEFKKIIKTRKELNPGMVVILLDLDRFCHDVNQITKVALERTNNDYINISDR